MGEQQEAEEGGRGRAGSREEEKGRKRWGRLGGRGKMAELRRVRGRGRS